MYFKKYYYVNWCLLFRAISKIINQLDIDPTELRGIGIQINKLENHTAKQNKCIENFISNMKSKQKTFEISCNEITVNPKIISTEIIESKCHQSFSTINIHNKEIKFTKNSNNLKTVKDFFKPKEDKLNSKNQSKTSVSGSNIPYQSFVNIKMSQVDPSFLNALPTDIRQEIENELKSNESQNSLSIEYENTSVMEETMTEESSKLYQHVHVDQMKDFVEEWVATENEPKTCDNIMVSEYLCNLIKDTKTEDAYEIIRKLYRYIIM